MLHVEHRGSKIGVPMRFVLTGLLAAVALAAGRPSLEAQTAPTIAQNPTHPAVAPSPSVPHGVTYSGGQLTIEAQNSTLWDLLTKVATATGIKIDIPSEANADRIPAVRLGPGPARQVLASLLRDTRFNFVIAESEADPDKLQSVLVMPVDTRDSAPGGKDVEASGRGPRSVGAGADPGTGDRRADTELSEASATGSSAPPESNGTPSATPGMAEPAVSPGSLNSQAVKSAALSPPPVLDQQSITQQLQQMYQQRVQMIQQTRQTGSASH